MKRILKKILPRSLRHQIALLIGCLGIITVIIHSGIMFYHQYQLTKLSLEKTTQQQFNLAKPQIIEAFIYHDLYTLFQISNRLSENINYLQNIYVLNEYDRYITDAKKEKSYPLNSLKQKNYFKIKKEPILLKGQLLGYFVFVIDISESRKALINTFFEALILNLCIVLIGVIAGVRLTIFIIRPIEELNEDIRNLKKRKIPATSPLGYSSDEVRLLRKTLSHSLFQLWEQEQKMLTHEKRALIGVMAAGLAHELKTPVMTIKLLVNSLKNDEPSEERYADMQVIENESDRLVNYVNEFLDFSKPLKPHLKKFQWETLIHNCQDLIKLQKYDFTLKTTGATREWVYSDFDKLLQVFQNIINNAREAGSTYLELLIKEHSDEWVLSFIDNGPMIDPEIQEQIFHPFVTTKKEGTGLGLAICKTILEALNGSLTLDIKNKNANAFIIHLKKHKEPNVEKSSHYR